VQRAVAARDGDVASTLCRIAAQRTGFFRFDGRRIAFATVGEGRPIVLPAWWVSNVVEDWKEERFRRFVEGLASGRQVVRYDRLGCGTSDRERPRETLTLEYELALLEALVEHLGLGRFSIVGGSYGGCTAIRYAAAYPERVDRLVLYGAFAHGAELAGPAAREAMSELVRRHWGLGSRMLADTFVPSGSGAERSSFAAFQRRSASATMAADLLELTFATDVRETASELAAPTLVLHRRNDRVIRLAAGEQLAALAPNATLVVLPGDAHLPWHGEMDDVLAAVAPFLGIAAPVRETRGVVEELSPRERDVLRLVADGLSDADIAERLVLSPHTVHRHVANILTKLGVHSRAAAAAHAARAGIL
jgi:pimeloyl-ACP methyl ester carboxylesterase/DNA-binding CsgD family transcriptional regulator